MAISTCLESKQADDSRLVGSTPALTAIICGSIGNWQPARLESGWASIGALRVRVPPAAPYGYVAQLEEHPAVNRKVVGSNPSIPANMRR